MDIKVIQGRGSGRTILSAFDSALQSAGVFNYNLIPLSSIIPPNSKVAKIKHFKTPPNDWGNKLYVILAHHRSDEVNKFIAAGLGWYQTDDGRGVFVEHEIIGETFVAVQSEIKLRILNSLKDLCSFRKIQFKKKNAKSSIVITQVKEQPTCVLVVAVYKSEGWE